ncbi:MAG: hypothetical protein WED04_08390 [Promethearchaeati archaeon SRVP18_Atabeyarchaeia-1]
MEQLLPPGEASRLLKACLNKTSTDTARVTVATHRERHRWMAMEGEKRPLTVRYQASESVLTYLRDMRDALKEALAHGYALAETNPNKEVPNPIMLRRKVKPWFDARYSYAKHHVNPLCRSAVALLRSYRKRNKKLGLPRISRLAMRIDSELFRFKKNDGGAASIRVTLQPLHYEYITFTPSHKKWSMYSSAGKISEILLTDRKLCITFVVGADSRKPLGKRLVGSDLNFHSMDSTAFGGDGLEPPHTEPLGRIVQVQNDFSRRRRRLQLHVKNPKKRARKLTETRGRQKNRVTDELHKLSTRIVRENPGTSFIFEDLEGIRGKAGKRKTTSRKLRTYLNRWPY